MRKNQEIDVLHSNQLEKCQFQHPDSDQQFLGWALSREAAQRGEIGTINGTKLTDCASISVGMGYNHQTINLYAVWGAIPTTYVPSFPPIEELEPEPILSILWTYSDFSISGLSVLSNDTTTKIAWTAKKIYRYSNSTVDISSEIVSSDGYVETSESFSPNGEMGSGISTATRQLTVWFEKQPYGRASCVVSQGGYMPTYKLYIAKPQYSYYHGNKPVPDEYPQFPEMPTEWYLPSDISVETVSGNHRFIHTLVPEHGGISSVSGILSARLWAPDRVWLSWWGCTFVLHHPKTWVQHSKPNRLSSMCGMWFDYLSGWKSSKGRFVRTRHGPDDNSRTPEDLISAFDLPGPSSYDTSNGYGAIVQLCADAEEIWTPVYVNPLLPRTKNLYSDRNISSTYDPQDQLDIFSKKTNWALGSNTGNPTGVEAENHVFMDGKCFPCAGTLKLEGDFGIDLKPLDGNQAIPKHMSGGFKISTQSYATLQEMATYRWHTVADVRAEWTDKDAATGKPRLRNKFSVSIPVERYTHVKLHPPYYDGITTNLLPSNFSDGKKHSLPGVEAFLSSATFTHEETAVPSIDVLDFETDEYLPKVIFQQDGSYASQIILPENNPKFGKEISSRPNLSAGASATQTYTGSQVWTDSGCSQFALSAVIPLETSRYKVDFIANGSFYELEISHDPCNDGKDDVYPEISSIHIAYTHPLFRTKSSFLVFEPPAGKTGPANIKFGVYVPFAKSVFGKNTVDVVVGWKKHVSQNVKPNSKSVKLQSISVVKQKTWEKARLID